MEDTGAAAETDGSQSAAWRRPKDRIIGGIGVLAAAARETDERDEGRGKLRAVRFSERLGF